MIPILIGAALGGAGAAAYKIFEREKNSHEDTFTRYPSKDEIPPDVVKKVRQLERIHQLDKIRGKVVKVPRV